MPHLRRFRRVFAGFALGLLCAASASAQTKQRTLYVSVLDRQGAPVKDLTPEGIVVREDGVAREVLKVEPATDPMRVVLLVDNSQAASRAIQFLRDGLGRFVNRITAAGHSVSFVTLADRPTLEVDATKDAATLKSRGVDRLFARPGAGMYLLDAIIETSRGLVKNEVPRAVMVAVITEGVEFSNASYQQVLEAIRDSGAAFHALVITGEAEADQSSDEVRNRNVVLDRGTREFGGRRETLISTLAIPDALDKLATELLNQYKVTYASPERLIPAERITVEAADKALIARGVPAKVSNP